MAAASNSELRLRTIFMSCGKPSSPTTGLPRDDYCLTGLNSPSQHRRDLLDLHHQLIELVGIERLHAIGQGVVGIVMDFNHQAVSSGSYGGACQRRDFVALAGTVAGIGDDRQVTQALHSGNHAEIERVARVIDERAHAALAQHHIVVALTHHVFGGHEKFFERRRNAPLQQYRLAGASGALKQREVLHVAGAELDNVGIFLNQLQRLMVHRLGDDQQAEAIANFRHDLQAVFAHPLKRVRRRARLVGAAAKELGSRAGHALGDVERLVAVLDRTGPGDDGQIRPADGGGEPRELDDRVVRLHVAAHQFVWLAHSNHLLDTGHFVERARFDLALVAGYTDGGALLAGNGVGAISKRLDFLANGADLFFGSLRLHDDQHREYPELLSLASGVRRGQTEDVVHLEAPRLLKIDISLLDISSICAYNPANDEARTVVHQFRLSNRGIADCRN